MGIKKLAYHDGIEHFEEDITPDAVNVELSNSIAGASNVEDCLTQLESDLRDVGSNFETHEIKIASSSQLGHIKLGETLETQDDGTVNTKTMSGATQLSNGSAGIVPAPATYDKEKYLRGDGIWETPQDTTTGTTYNAGSCPDNITFGTNGTIKNVYDNSLRRDGSNIDDKGFSLWNGISNGRNIVSSDRYTDTINLINAYTIGYNSGDSYKVYFPSIFMIMIDIEGISRRYEKPFSLPLTDEFYVGEDSIARITFKEDEWGVGKINFNIQQNTEKMARPIHVRIDEIVYSYCHSNNSIIMGNGNISDGNALIIGQGNIQDGSVNGDSIPTTILGRYCKASEGSLVIGEKIKVGTKQFAMGDNTEHKELAMENYGYGYGAFGITTKVSRWDDSDEVNAEFGYSGIISTSTAVLSLKLATQGMYMLCCSSYTTSTGAIYGATTRMITAHGYDTGTPSNLTLGQTTNAPAAIAMAPYNTITIKNGSTARYTQFQLIRLY